MSFFLRVLVAHGSCNLPSEGATKAELTQDMDLEKI